MNVCVLVGCRELGSEWEGGPYAGKGGGNIRAVQQSTWCEILTRFSAVQSEVATL